MTSPRKLVPRDGPEGPPRPPSDDDDEPSESQSGPRRRPFDDAELVQALGEGQAWAERTLLDRHGAHVERILVRILGAHPDLDDLALEVFVRAFQNLSELRNPAALKSWLTAIAVFVAREAIRARQRRRWLRFLPIEEAIEVEVTSSNPEARAALRAVYEVVGRLDADVGIAFTLRFIEGMDLAEIASACGVSLATVKRRLKVARDEFSVKGRTHEALAEWFEEGTLWPSQEG